MGARPSAVVLCAAEQNVALVIVVDGQILPDQLVDARFERGNIDIRLVLVEFEHEAVADIAVAARKHLLLRHGVFAQILRAVRHEAIGKRRIDDVAQLLRQRAKEVRPRDDDLLADADEQIRVDAEQGIDQVKMLDDDALAAPDSQPDGVRQLRELMEARLEADVQMVGVRREKARFILLLQKRERADVDAVVVVRKLDAGEHPLDEHALAGAGLPDEADDLVEGRKIKLRDLHTERVDPAAAAGSKIRAVDMAALNRVCRHMGLPPVPFSFSIEDKARFNQGKSAASSMKY